jgi:L-lactate dehydrogenase (cytochrome)
MGARSTSSDPDAHRAQGVVGLPEASLPRRLRRLLSLDNFEAAARRHLPRPIFGYVAGAAESNAPLNDNRAVFGELGFLQRVLTDVSGRSQETTLFGHRYAAPFGLAPMGISALVAYRGDLVLARAAAQANIPMVMSGSSLIRLEEVAKAAPGSWFQAYLPGEPRRIAALVERVAQAGFGTLVLTVDTAVLSNRENNIRSGFSTRCSRACDLPAMASPTPAGRLLPSPGRCYGMACRTSRTLTRSAEPQSSLKTSRATSACATI